MARQCCQMTSESKGHFESEPLIPILLVLVHDNQYANYYTDTQSDTTDIRLISVHVLRTELQVFMGSAAGGPAAPSDFGGLYSKIYKSIIKFLELNE